MLMKTMTLALMAAGMAAVAAPSASAAIRITEWLYAGAPGEYFELTNIGGPAVDFTGWSYSDEDNIPGAFSLSGLGIVAPGQSVVVTEADAAAFKTAWNIPTVTVLGGLSPNLGRNDAIYIYDASNAPVDILDYGDESTPGAGPRTQNASGNPLTLAALGANDPAQWTLAVAGDAYGSYANANGTLGNPGEFALIPEPGSMALCALGLIELIRRRRASR